MIKIKMKALSAGPHGIRPVGWEGDVPSSEARALIAGRYAVALTPPLDAAPARVLDALKAAGELGMTRSNVSRLFQGNKNKRQLDEILSVLKGAKLADFTRDGKKETWVAIE